MHLSMHILGDGDMGSAKTRLMKYVSNQSGLGIHW